MSPVRASGASLTRSLATLGLLLALACSDARSHARATAVLIDVSGTYYDHAYTVHVHNPALAHS